MWSFTADRAHSLADEWLREADARRLAASVPRSDRPGLARRSAARAAAATSRISASVARALDARALEERGI